MVNNMVYLKSTHLRVQPVSWYTLSNDSTRTTIDAVILPKLPAYNKLCNNTRFTY